MSATIGIHQKQEQVDKLYENLGLTAAPLTAVGPFSSRPLNCPKSLFCPEGSW